MRKPLSSEEGLGDLVCSAYDRNTDITLEARDTHAAARDTEARRADPTGRVAQRITKASWSAAKTPIAACTC